MNKEEELPEFIKKYRDKTPNEESWRHFEKVSREYKAEVLGQHGKHLHQVDSQKLHNRTFGADKSLTIEPALAAIEKDYDEKAKNVAKQYGYKEEIADKDLTEKQEEMIEKINKAKDPTPSTDPQPEAKKQEVPLTDREQKRKADLEEIMQKTERNRSLDKDRGR